MTQLAQEQTALDADLDSSPRRFLPLLLLLFIGSGCAALIYEIVWFQLLQLVIGSSAYSIAVLLGTFMGGMCLGSLALARIVSARRHPLRVYSFIELFIGIFGLVILFGMPHINQLYATHYGRINPGIGVRAIVCVICLLPPTLLMGASLPAIGRWLESTPHGVSWLGFFYGGNIAGAVFGSLLAGFYLLRLFNMEIATYAAAAINFAVAILGFVLASQTPHNRQVLPAKAGAQRPAPAHGRFWVYLAIAFSGLTALGAEVIWTRLLSLILGGTVYTFSIILAVFLFGLGIGSSVGSVIARGSPRPRMALGICQLLLVAAIGWTAYQLSTSLPYWPINTYLSTDPWFIFQLDLMRCIWAILPAALLWGASFPLALGSVAAPGHDPGRLVGGVYAANTVGAILGAVGASLILVPRLGTHGAQQTLIIIAGCAAMLMLLPVDWLGNRAPQKRGAPFGSQEGAILAIVAVIVIWATGFFALNVAPKNDRLIAYGRTVPINLDEVGSGKIVYSGEGMNSSIAVSQFTDGTVQFHVSGKVEASTNLRDMRLQRMLGHIPALIHPNPQSVLIVGCGAGVTAGTFVVHRQIKQITICELEPLIPPMAAKYFSEQNHDVLSDPRTHIVFDDARHFVLTTPNHYDIITSDPIHPWVKGSATLYTEEYFQMCKDHLNPGGICTQWVPLYESNMATVKSEVATFMKVFPNGIIWNNGNSYDVVMLGQADPIKIDITAMQRRLDEEPDVAASLRDVNFFSAIDLLATYGNRTADMSKWLESAQINHDIDLRLQYLAGFGLNLVQEGDIFRDMERTRRYPDEIFTGSEEAINDLRAAIQQPPGD
jgi:spermidine synthase